MPVVAIRHLINSAWLALEPLLSNFRSKNKLTKINIDRPRDKLACLLRKKFCFSSKSFVPVLLFLLLKSKLLSQYIYYNRIYIIYIPIDVLIFKMPNDPNAPAKFDIRKNPVYQIDCLTQNKGKRFAATKRRVRWRFGFSNLDAIESGCTGMSCRGAEHEVVFVWSLTSGKQLILADGHEVHWAKSSNREKFEFTWNMNGNHEMKVIAHASLLNMKSENCNQFDLLIDGLSFWNFPKIFQLGNKNKRSGGSGGRAGANSRALQEIQQQQQHPYSRSVSVPDLLVNHYSVPSKASANTNSNTTTTTTARSPTSSMDMSVFDAPPQQQEQQQQKKQQKQQKQYEFSWNDGGSPPPSRTTRSSASHNYNFAWNDSPATPRTSFNENAFKGYPIQAIATPDVSRSASPIVGGFDSSSPLLLNSLESLSLGGGGGGGGGVVVDHEVQKALESLVDLDSCNDTASACSTTSSIGGNSTLSTPRMYQQQQTSHQQQHGLLYLPPTMHQQQQQQVQQQQPAPSSFQHQSHHGSMSSLNSYGSYHSYTPQQTQQQNHPSFHSLASAPQYGSMNSLASFGNASWVASSS